MKKLLPAILLLIISLASCDIIDNKSEENKNVAVTGVTLNKASTTILERGTEQLFETVSPTDATNKNVTWSSDDEGIATVSSSGLVAAVSIGSATITVTTEDGDFTGTCTVTVIPPRAQWARTVTVGPNASLFRSVATDDSGNIYAAGIISRTGTFNFGNSITAAGAFDDYNVVLVKYNSAGTAQWAKTAVTALDESNFYSVAVDNSGNIYAAGYFTCLYGPGTINFGNGVTATGISLFSILLVKYNSAGEAQWVKTVTAAAGYSAFRAVAVDNSGNIYTAGYIYGTGAFGFGDGVTAENLYSSRSILVPLPCNY